MILSLYHMTIRSCLLFFASLLFPGSLISGQSFLKSQLSKNHDIECPLQTAPGSFDYLLEEAYKHQSGAIVIIGANIGSNGNDFNWKFFKIFPYLEKVLVEPIPPLFQQLTENVKSHGLENVQLFNVAITNSSESMTMYCINKNAAESYNKGSVNNAKFPFWFTQICSGSYDRLFSSYDLAKFVDKKIIAKSIEKHSVSTMTYAALASKVKAPIRLLQIDVEGFDDEIIYQLPLADKNFNPDIIMFEHILLSKQRYENVLAYIHKFGYKSCQSDSGSQNTFLFRDPFIQQLYDKKLQLTENLHKAIRHDHQYTCSKLTALMGNKHPMAVPWGQHSSGTVVTIGANVGPVFLDTNWNLAAQRHSFHKIYLEPVPSLFLGLKKNALKDRLSQGLFLQKVLVPNSYSSPNITMYCIRSKSDVSSYWLDKKSEFPLCSVSKERLYHYFDVGIYLTKFQIDALVYETTVSAITVASLLSDHVKSPVRMFLISAEGIDDKIVMSLPLADESFRPDIILFSNAYLKTVDYARALDYLHNNSYSTCQRSPDNPRTFAFRAPR